MDRRQQFHEVLEALNPATKVYFQPPETVKMVYPCIVYQRDPGNSKFANNKPYAFHQLYEVKLISRSPEPALFDELVALPQSIHARFFVADNLNHDVFSIYF